jgi:hypothetical protein
LPFISVGRIQYSGTDVELEQWNYSQYANNNNLQAKGERAPNWVLSSNATFAAKPLFLHTVRHKVVFRGN